MDKPAILLNLVVDVKVELEFSGDTGNPHDPESSEPSPEDGTNIEYTLIGPLGCLNKLKMHCQSGCWEPKGKLSPLCHINVPSESREALGVPADARYFAFVYPADGAHAQLKKLNLKRDPWGWVLLVGGFCYFNRFFEPVRINAFSSAQDPTMQMKSSSHTRQAASDDAAQLAKLMSFRGPTPVAQEAVSALESQGRLCAVTAEELRRQGYRSFAWVHPKEAVGGHRLSDTDRVTLYGAFVYVQEDGTAISFRLSTASTETVADFFRSEASSKSPFSFLSERIASDCLRHSREEAESRAQKAIEDRAAQNQNRRRSINLLPTVGDVVFLAERKSREDQKPWFILHPEGGLMGAWDVFGTSALVWTAIVTPFEVGFLPASESLSDPLFIINRVVDGTHSSTPRHARVCRAAAFLPSCLTLALHSPSGIFLFDMLVQFLLMYRVSARGSPSSTVVWESRPSFIRRHYLRGWFGIDFFSMLPSSFDIIPLVFEDDGSSESTQSLRVLRTIRALRLIKLVRLVRSSRIIKRQLAKFPISCNKPARPQTWRD